MRTKISSILVTLLLVPIMLCTGADAAVTLINLECPAAAVDDGQSATFAITVETTDPPATFQWTKNGVNVYAPHGLTSSTYTIPAVEYLRDNGTVMDCLVGDASTAPASLGTCTLAVNPLRAEIIRHPEDQTVIVTFRATFTVLASGTKPLTYQWQFSTDGGGSWDSIVGATGSSFRTWPTTMADDGTLFRCQVDNEHGGPRNSNPALLTVTDRAPTIFIHPSSRTVEVGENAPFSVWALGTDLQYQWQERPSGYGWSDIPGATGNAYNTGPATVEDHHDKDYRCIVSNTGGTATSNAATLTVVGAPTITTHPSDQTVAEGETATFSIVVTGSTYQWEKRPWGGTWAAIPGATGTSYTTPPTTMADDQTRFRCLVTNDTGTVTSGIAVLTVLGAGAPVITTHPANKTVYVGQTATFTVAAAGTSPLNYQWQERPPAGTWGDIPGETGTSYTTPLLSAADNGARFRCIVTNADGTATSGPAILTVLAPSLPTIITDPSDVTACEGGTATFSIVATDSVPLNYQWERRNGAPWVDIPGATSDTYTTPPLTNALDDGARFRCRVSNAAGSVDSGAALLTVILPVLPVIVTPPAPQQVCLGQTATFTVAASTSCPPLSYQWLQFASAIPGATSPSYTTPPVGPLDSGDQFTCVVTNAAGSINAGPATLVVDATPPIIITEPQSQTACVGQTVTFTIQASSVCQPLTYQWREDTGGGPVNIPGATSASYTTPPVGVLDNLDVFDCEVSIANDATLAILSAQATLTVDNTPPTITTQPTNQGACIGGTATFTCAATTTCPPLSYQWMLDTGSGFSFIGGATSSTYTTPPVGPADHGNQYRCDVSNSAIAPLVLQSAVVFLTVDSTPPSINADPLDQVVCEGDTATFTVVASSTCPGVTYQWQRRESGTPPFVNIPGANSATYTTPPVVAATDDLDEFRCLVSNDGGSTPSGFAVLDVDNVLPTITTNPSNQTVCDGQTATFTVEAASPCPGLTYQWQRRDSSTPPYVNIPGATSATYTTPPVVFSTDDQDEFRCQVSNGAGTTNSALAVLTVDSTPPTITMNPSDQTVCAGQTATFTVGATSVCPSPTYQWQEDTGGGYLNIPGATSETYNRPAVIVADDGNLYRCRVRNGGGTVFSTGATLTVDQTVPTITTNPSNQTICLGQTATFTVEAAAACPPLTYQWQRDSGGGFNPILGATSASYTTPVTTLAYNNDLFRCRVTNAYGAVFSSAALLTLDAALPTITSDPSDQAVCEGQTATFTVVATSICPLTYQWQRYNTGAWGPITGATSATYTTPPTTPAYNNDLFRCRVTNAAGTTTSAAATLTLDAVPPAITTNPVSQTLCLGQSATFTVVATTGCPPVTYQWQRDTGSGFANISGATSATYTTPATTPAYDNDFFRCRVTNAAGTTTSTAALLTLDSAPPTITTQPTNQTVCDGQAATFTVAATSACQLSYQWRKNGVNISGATSATYTTPPVTSGDNGALFLCRVTNAVGTTTSAAALLTVGSAPPTITTDPTNQTVCEGQTATFAVAATTGCPPVSYQWRKNGANISGATSATYTTPPTVAADDGALFLCRVTNSAGSTDSAAALLTVGSAPPTITTDPTNQTVCEGQTAAFTVAATTGCPPVSYQWRKNGANISGATSATYTTPPTAVADDGALFLCRVTNSAGFTDSAAALLTVDNTPPTITSDPVNQTVCEGQTAAFTVAATSGCPPVTYQWRKNTGSGFANISGATSATYTTPPTVAADDGALFLCRVTNSAGSTDSAAALLTVDNTPPTITGDPASQTVCEGQTATFTVAATSGCGPVTYRWQKDTGSGFANISGATSATYTTPPTVAADNGHLFRCRVINAAGGTASAAALLTVDNTPPTVIINPADQTVCEGQTATFTVAAISGCGPISYQWRKNTGSGFANISGATSPIYTTPPTVAADNGHLFLCRVTNAAGITDSAAAILTLHAGAPTITTNPSNQTVVEGNTATFTVVASSPCLPMSYQWRKNTGSGFANIPGATAATYTTPPTVEADDGTLFLCRVTNSAGSTDSAAALLIVQSGPPIILQDPQDQTVNVGETANFSVVATGPGTLGYQWLRDGIYVSGANSANYTTAPTVAGDDGAMFSCEVSNAGGTVTSSEAELTVLMEATAPFPFEENFETGLLADYWTPSSTGLGRIRVTTSYGPASGSYHLTMDSAMWMSPARNELILNVNLAGQTGVTLGFYHKEFSDGDHAMPASFTGSHNSDGVAVSQDGTTWYKVQGLTSADGISSAWQYYEVDLDAAIAAAGISYNSAFKIKFQQYGTANIRPSLGTNPFSDGFAFDEIELY